MGFFNDLFGGGSDRVADGYNKGIKTIRTAGKGATKTIKKSTKSATKTIWSGYKDSKKTLKTGFGDAKKALSDGRNQSLSALSGGLSNSLSRLGAGYDGAIGEQRALAEKAQDLFNPYVSGGQSAFKQMSDLQGLNGAAARDAARAGFTTDPGYEFRRDEGMRGLEGSAAANGRLQSGATLKALADYNGNLASQEYGNYFNRLGAISGQGMDAGNSLMGALGQSSGTISNLMAQRGGAEAGLYSDFANNSSGIQSQYGNNLANLRSGLSTNIANSRTQMAADIANLRSQSGLARADIRFKTGLGIAPYQAQKSEAIAAGASGTAGSLAGLVGGLF